MFLFPYRLFLYSLPRVLQTKPILCSLNLAVANTVHIFEPQWNPMVESQAVARVVRLGQKKPVSIIRYIIRGTVEQASYHV